MEFRGHPESVTVSAEGWLALNASVPSRTFQVSPQPEQEQMKSFHFLPGQGQTPDKPSSIFWSMVVLLQAALVTPGNSSSHLCYEMGP